MRRRLVIFLIAVAGLGAAGIAHADGIVGGSAPPAVSTDSPSTSDGFADGEAVPVGTDGFSDGDGFADGEAVPVGTDGFSDGDGFADGE